VSVVESEWSLKTRVQTFKNSLKKRTKLLVRALNSCYETTNNAILQGIDNAKTPFESASI
jgi:hypothetical protein